jgi:hypothetical protein
MVRVNWLAGIAGAIVMTMNSAIPAQTLAPKVSFTLIDDAVASRFFNPATTRAAAADPNQLIIGFNTGLDTSTLKYRDFRASTAAYSYTAAMDTIGVKITAPANHYITKITYNQRGSGSMLRTGKASGGSTWTVGDVSSSLGTFTTNPTILNKTIDLTGQRRTIVHVSVTTSLYAFATPQLGSAMVQLTGADLKVDLFRYR